MAGENKEGLRVGLCIQKVSGHTWLDSPSGALNGYRAEQETLLKIDFWYGNVPKRTRSKQPNKSLRAVTEWLLTGTRYSGSAGPVC